MKPMKERIWDILDLLSVDGLDAFSGFELAFQILAWAKLSYEDEIPYELHLSKCSSRIDSQLLCIIFEQLSQLEELGEQAQAFNLCKAIDGQGLTDAIRFAEEAARFGLLSPLDFEELPYQSLERDFGRIYGLLNVPGEVRALMINLAEPLNTNSVYCPYDQSCQLAFMAASKGAAVAVEFREYSVIPYVTQLLTDVSFRISCSDPIRQPGFIDHRSLEKFDVTLSFPPINVKYDREVVQNDWFQRSFPQTTNGNVLQIYHIIAQTEGRAIIAVNQGILFSGGAEKSLRKYLLDKGMIEGVIEMPSALLPLTFIPFSILILNTHGGVKEIRFVNGGHDKFFERNLRGQSTLTHWQELLEAYKDDVDESICHRVNVVDVLRNDAKLSVSNYLVTPEKQQVNILLQQSKTKILDQLVDIYRPLRKSKAQGETIVFEVSVLDFPKFGYLEKPQNTITLPEISTWDKDADSFLRSLDIVIVIKGKTGQISIAPESLSIESQDRWVVNQSCLILRAKPQMIDPKVLYMFLRSDVGQSLLRGLESGATMPLIQLAELKKMPVILPTDEEKTSIIKAFDDIIQLQDQINSLILKQQEKKKMQWNIELSE